MTNALSQPWHVRCPDTKYSVYGTCLTVLIELRSTSSVGRGGSAIAIVLLPNPDPMHVALQVTRGCGLQDREHLLSIVSGDFATAQPSNEVNHCRPLRTVVERGAEL